MKYLLDTDTCVFWLRGHRQVQRRLVDAGLEQVAVSVITLAELRYGADCSRYPDANHEAIDAFIGGIPILHVEPETASIFGEIKARLRQQGLLLADFDLLIAATALTYELIVVTNNIKHFRRIPALPLESWA